MVKRILLLAAAGAVGTLARYWLSGAVQRISSTTFPWGTLAVNGSGCFLFGLVWALADEPLLISGHTRLILLVGFMARSRPSRPTCFRRGRCSRPLNCWSALPTSLSSN